MSSMMSKQVPRDGEQRLHAQRELARELTRLVHGDEQLSMAARKHVEAASCVWVSAITAWEIGMLVAEGRLTADEAAPILDALEAASGDIVREVAGRAPGRPAASPRLPLR